MIDPSPASGISVDRCMFCCYSYPKPIKKLITRKGASCMNTIHGGVIDHCVYPKSNDSSLSWRSMLLLFVIFCVGCRWIGVGFCFVYLLFLQPNPLFWLVWLFVSLLHKITNKHTTIIIYITSGMLSVYMLALVQGLAVPGSSESLLLLAAILAGIIILSLCKVPLLYIDGYNLSDNFSGMGVLIYLFLFVVGWCR